MITTVIHHSADYDGIFCREIARKFLPDATLIGWDFADAPLAVPKVGQVYVLDLPVDRVFGFRFGDKIEDMTGILNVFGDANGIKEFNNRLVWIDHHKSSIDSHPKDIPGYLIDGVAACRLAWQWFTEMPNFTPGFELPTKDMFVDRAVSEPMAVRLAGEYDIWDKRDPDAEVFQFGLRSRELDDNDWKTLLSFNGGLRVEKLLECGELLQRYQRKIDKSLMESRGFDVTWEGRRFLCVNTGRFNSLTFDSAVKPEHDALLGFSFNGKNWTVSLYHAPHPACRTIDLSAIAVKYGGGGHKGACGFVCDKLPFLQ